MHGDIAFFTQPIIAGHAGSQAFARRREKIFAQYEKGFEEYRKSGYFRDRARIARETRQTGPSIGTLPTLIADQGVQERDQGP